jgi:hypothetical protein
MTTDSKRQSGDRDSSTYAVALAVVAAGLSLACFLYLAKELLASYGIGPDWSRPWYAGLGETLATLAILCLIAVASVVSLRAAWRTEGHLISTAFTTLLAGPSAVFAIGTLCFVGYVAVALIVLPEHPNRKLFALHDAACKADKEGVRRALAAGISPSARWTNTSPGDGGDALAAYFKCFRNGQTLDREIVDLLLAAGSAPTSRPAGAYPDPLEVVVLNAGIDGRAAAVEYLVGKGYAPSGASPSRGGTLGIAAGRADVDTLKILLKLGARPELPGLTDRLVLANKNFCSERAARARPDEPSFNAKPFFDAADLLLESGLVVSTESLAKGKAFCTGSENAMVAHLEMRLAARK